MSAYNHKKIEAKWQKEWAKRKLYKTNDSVKGKENFYTLVEFPYPSGNLHTGHWYAFSVPDIFVRAKRMQGYNVMFPIGFDAFGLPAENAAIKRKLNPRAWTYDNIDYMRKQLHAMGASFDWSREVITADPEYYRWTQWLFLQMYKKGLAYQAETSVNWCSHDKTVLANEQVIAGKCERCGATIEQRTMKQWMLKITRYADSLLDGLEKLNWPNEIKEAQRNWIGKSEGARIKFYLKNIPGQIDKKHFVEVFTTRPDTLYGATFLVISPEIAKKWIDVGWKTSPKITEYIKKAFSKKELERLEGNREKTGVDSGITAINPGNNEEIPVWVADYVLGSYGTGAIMAVPQHDERDREFAERFHLSIVDRPLVDKNEVVKKVHGEMTAQYRLRDWVLSRQRYWGCPIPVIHCKTCGVVMVPEKDLPVKLPEIKDYLPTGDGKSPLAKAKKWVETSCPQCNGKAERETDTMDTFVDSSWYFLRYCDSKNSKKFVDAKKMKQWMQIDMYSGGAEHTTMHLLYSRFFMKALYDLKLVEWDEPYIRRMNRGIILGPDGQKMSKSKGNVIDPDEYVKKLGADTVRIYLAFIGPYNEVGSYPWDPKSILGVRRFLDRVWLLGLKLLDENSRRGRAARNKSLPLARGDKEFSDNSLQAQTERLLHKSIKKIGEDIVAFHFNTAISQLMILMNEMEKTNVSQEFFETFLKLLAPFAPHLADELWHQLGNPIAKSIHQEAWPTFDPKLLEEDSYDLIVQVNGKVRDKFTVPINISQKEAERLTLSREKVKTILGGGQPKKIIFIPKRLINIVV